MSTIEIQGIITPSDEEVEEARSFASELCLEYVDLSRYPVNVGLSSVLPEEIARTHHCAVAGSKYGAAVVAIARPESLRGLDEVRSAINRDIYLVIACASQIDSYIDRVYRRGLGEEVASGDEPAADPPGGLGEEVVSSGERTEEETGEPTGGGEAPGATGEPGPGEVDGAVTAEATPEPGEPTGPAEGGGAAELPPTGAQGEWRPEMDAVLGEALDSALAAESGFGEGASLGSRHARPIDEVFGDDDDAVESAVQSSAPEVEADVVDVALAEEGVQPGEELEVPATPGGEEAERGAAPTGAEEGGVVEELDQGDLWGDDVAGLVESEDGSGDPPAGDLEGDEAFGGEDPYAGYSDAGIDEPPPLAEVLLKSGQVTEEEMEAALREQAATGRSLGQILSGLGLVSDEDLIRAMATEAGMEFVDLNEWATDPVAVALIPEAMARRHQVLAIGFRGEVPVVALSNPSDVFALDDLRMLLGREFATVVASPRHIAEYISRVYRSEGEAEAAARSAASDGGREREHSALEIGSAPAAVEDAPIVKYVNLILRQALQERASDVHVEPTAEDLRIRFRIDGVLHDMTRSPRSIHGGVTTRLKVMANLDIAEHRLPQDGRISLSVADRQVDLRVATLPTVHGEKVVLRVLDKSNAMLDLQELGFLPSVRERYEKAYRKPYGTILVTGPTGSGKSTTLYATLSQLNSPERNLITVEDPVEYQLPGVNQVQVNPRAGLVFATALRSILRSDPNVILVGEVRDKETAVIAIEAALTGHLVMSSVHTNDAAATPMRLVEMGVEPFLVGSALDCVLAQRLARQLCENCAEAYDPTEEELELVGWSDDDLPEQGSARFQQAVGCQACSHTGFRGRLALHELMLLSEEIERAIVSNAAADEINKIAVEQGMIPLMHDGLRKAALGLTSIEEVLRVVA